MHPFTSICVSSIDHFLRVFFGGSAPVAAEDLLDLVGEAGVPLGSVGVFEFNDREDTTLDVVVEKEGVRLKDADALSPGK